MTNTAFKARRAAANSEVSAPNTDSPARVAMPRTMRDGDCAWQAEGRRPAVPAQAASASMASCQVTLAPRWRSPSCEEMVERFRA